MSSAWSGKGTVSRLVVPCRAERSPEAASAAINLPSIRLRPLPVAEGNALVAGSGAPPAGLRWHPDYPMTETLEALGMILAAHRVMGLAADAEPDWWISQIVLGDLVVGDIGFHGPPVTPLVGQQEVDVEIGYNVVPELRGRGIATRAVGLLLEQAWRAGATVVRAETDADNAASRGVLLRAGFTALGHDQYAITRPELS
ncbi:MAG: GNAT family N-acetyltransferase [Propionibacteriaceae bacterium]